MHRLCRCCTTCASRAVQMPEITHASPGISRAHQLARRVRMKKQARKFTLSRETVRTLETNDLRAVQGGMPNCQSELSLSSSVSHYQVLHTHKPTGGDCHGDSC